MQMNILQILFSAKTQLPRTRSREYFMIVPCFAHHISITTQLLPDSIHRDQINVSVFKPEWIVVVVKKKAGMSSVPIGQYFLSPFSAPSLKVKTTDEVMLPIVPEVKLVESQPEHQTEEQKESGTSYSVSKCVNCNFLT